MAKQPLDTTEMIESSDEFEAAYRSHAPLIYRFLFWRTNDSQLSEDLTSRVFENAWRRRGSFRGGNLKAWLYRIARNVLTDHWRKKTDIPTDNIDSLAESTDSGAAAALDQAWLVEQLEQALDKLPADMRAVIELRFMRGLSSKQTAKSLGLSDNNVRIIQYRALKKLRSHLE